MKLLLLFPALVCAATGGLRQASEAVPHIEAFEGVDPVHDVFGPAIYGGRVQRDPQTGEVVFSRQYKVRGPVYAGGGYTEMSRAIIQDEPMAVQALLLRDDSLVREVSTGGATPLHICATSRGGQHSTEFLIQAGADIEALDAYGYTPLHRAASNNLETAAIALLAAGADGTRRTSHPYAGHSPMSLARAAGAWDVVEALHSAGVKE